jgi:hypothetical protein
MTATASVFLNINLPNAATWFYFSGLLAMALFFKFSRLLSIRNWDVLTLYLLTPGLLLLSEADELSRWGGYVWLLGASGYFAARCLFDLALERRPALAPNLNRAGLIWMAVTLYLSLIAVAVFQPAVEPREGQPSSPITKPGDVLVKKAERDGSDVRAAVERGLWLGCQLSVVVGLLLVGWRLFDDLHTGAAAAAFYLLLPYTHLLLPWSKLEVGRWDQAWPMALMVWMVLGYRRPILTGTLLGVATGSVFFPALAAPVWLSFYRGRGAWRFALSFTAATALCLTLIGVVIWINGEPPPSLRDVWEPRNWLPWLKPRPEAHGVWQGESWAYRTPVCIAYLAFVVGTLFWPAPKNLAHVLALTAAVFLGVQFWYADQGGVYVLWYLPYLVLLVFRPNLSQFRPQPIPDDWLARLSRRLARALRWLFRTPARENVST